jgi:dipeptidyl-peptidase-4
MDLETLPRQISRTQYFTLGIARSFTISSDGNRIVYLRTRGGEDRVSCLWLLEHGVEQTLVDPVTLSGGETVSVSEQTRRARTHEFSTGIVTYSTDQEVRVVAFVLNGQLWVVGLDGESPRMISTFGSAFDPHFDPTGRRIAYVSEGSLRVVDVFSGEDWELARPDTPDVSYGVAEHVAAEEMHRLRGFWWAPDGERLLAARVDDSLVQRWWISDPANPQNSPRSIRYPVAGTDNSEVALYIFRLNGERTQVVWDHVSFEYLVSAAWDIHGPLLNVESRDQRTSQILSVDSNSGETTVLHEQSGFPWIHMTIGVPVRTESGVLVRVADVESSRRLVFDGRVVTADQVQVREVLGVDGENVVVFS